MVDRLVVCRVYAILEERILDFYASKKHFVDHDQALNSEGVNLASYKISDLSASPSLFGYGVEMEDEDMTVGTNFKRNIKKLFVAFLLMCD